MKHLPFNKATLFATLFLSIVVCAIGVTASYTEPGNLYLYPTNTEEPIDISVVDQVKTGGLSVGEFLARGNANFKQDVFVDGIIQGGQPGDTPTFVAIGTNTLVTGELRATKFLNSGTLTHTESSPKPVCGDAKGNVVFCTGTPGPGPGPQTDLCKNIPGDQTAYNADLTANPTIPGDCIQKIRGKIAVGDKGVYNWSDSRNSWLGTLDILSINITSVGGSPTTVWPSATPLKFKWGVCAKWNSSYSGPYILATFSNTNPDQGANGSLNPQKDPNGTCFSFPTSFVNGFSPALIHGAGNAHLVNLGYPDGDRNSQPLSGTGGWGIGGFTNGYTFNGNTFTGTQYTIGHTKKDPINAEIVYPVEKLILYQVEVPAGYSIELDAFPTSTVVEMYLK